jgi:hypothetical protein
VAVHGLWYNGSSKAIIYLQQLLLIMKSTLIIWNYYFSLEAMQSSQRERESEWVSEREREIKRERESERARARARERERERERDCDTRIA